ncbi:MAG: HNH endonuclease [Calditrichia bacterium]
MEKSKKVIYSVDCIVCGKNFRVKKCHVNVLKTCGKICANKNRSRLSKQTHEKFKKLGYSHITNETKNKMSESARSRGCNWGEQAKVKMSKKWIGERNPRWKPIGTVRTDSHGYNLVKVTDGEGFKNWRKEHLVIMENKIGRKIDTKRECCHHINGIKNDNRIENLILMTIRNHKIHHLPDTILKK